MRIAEALSPAAVAVAAAAVLLTGIVRGPLETGPDDALFIAGNLEPEVAATEHNCLEDKGGPTSPWTCETPAGVTPYLRVLFGDEVTVSSVTVQPGYPYDKGAEVNVPPTVTLDLGKSRVTRLADGGEGGTTLPVDPPAKVSAITLLFNEPPSAPTVDHVGVNGHG